MSETPDVICGVRAAQCVCVLPPGHDGEHHCSPHCGGQWYGGGVLAEDFRVVQFPGMAL